MILQIYPFSPLHWIFMLVGGLVLFIVNLFIAKYMHRDAIKRGITNNEFWLLFGFFLGVIGLLLYVFVRNDYQERK